MKKLKLIDKYKYSECDGKFVTHCRVYELTDKTDRVFIEYTSVHGGRLYRTWYCPEVHQYKNHKKIVLSNKKDKPYASIGGTGGLNYWFGLYGKRKH